MLSPVKKQRKTHFSLPVYHHGRVVLWNEWQLPSCLHHGQEKDPEDVARHLLQACPAPQSKKTTQPWQCLLQCVSSRTPPARSFLCLWELPVLHSPRVWGTLQTKPEVSAWQPLPSCILRFRLINACFPTSRFYINVLGCIWADWILIAGWITKSRTQIVTGDQQNTKIRFCTGKASVSSGFSGLHQARGRPVIRVTCEGLSETFLPSIALLNLKNKIVAA